MNFISKIPGPLLIFFGAFCLSFGGLIVKSFEGSTLWQILFWRQVFFIIVVTIFLIATYKKEVFFWRGFHRINEGGAETHGHGHGHGHGHSSMGLQQ